VRFHPNRKVAVAHWDVVDALSDKRNGKGILQTVHEERGGKEDQLNSGYNPARHDQHHHILGSYTDRASAKAAAVSIAGIKCKKPYPEHNCVDWTKKAIDHLHAKGDINEEKHKQFTDLYNAHQADVRKKTNTAENRKAAGVKPISYLLSRLKPKWLKWGKKT
jgi:hypothetical protein